MRSAEHKPEVDSAALLLDIRGAARVMGISPWQTRKIISDGSLPIIKVGRKFYVRRASLQRWAERSEGPVTA